MKRDKSIFIRLNTSVGIMEQNELLFYVPRYIRFRNTYSFSSEVFYFDIIQNEKIPLKAKLKKKKNNFNIGYFGIFFLVYNLLIIQ